MGNGDESGWVAPSTPEGNSLRISALACHLAFTHESLPVHCQLRPNIRKSLTQADPISHTTEHLDSLKKENTMKSKSFTAMAFAFLMLVAGTAITANAQQAQQNGNGSAAQSYAIEGGWLFNVVVSPGTPGPASFIALDTFAQGGGWSGHASTDSAVNWSPAYGTWKWSGHNVLITQYQFSQDPSGAPTGLVIIHKWVHFTAPDALAGESRVSFCDLNGQNCFSPPADAHVTAIKIKATS